MRISNKNIVTAYAPAKINAFLQVHGKRIDGYHDLFTYFQLVSLYDEITVHINNSGIIRVYNPDINIPEYDDLCYKAATLLKEFTNTKLGVDISIKKNIPDGAGLGGGSSDAATVLVLLNNLWCIGLSEKELIDISLNLGSDVPIFIYGKSTLAKGRGEDFISANVKNPIENKSIIIVKPNDNVSSKEIFQSGMLTKRKGIGRISKLDISKLIYIGDNDFSRIVYQLYPDVREAYELLSRFLPARLTGTGSCIYAVLDDEKKADRITRVLGDYYNVFLVKAIIESPLNIFK